MAFQASGRPLLVLLEFKYLGGFLTASDDSWPEFVGNLRKERNRWAHLLGIIGREGADPQNSKNFYKAVFQATLLFDAESWVMFT